MTFPHFSDEEVNLKKIQPKLARLIATFFNVGYFPKAPGTAASFLTTLLWAWPIYLGVSPLVPITCGFLLFILGTWSSKHARPFFSDEDPSAIVIDEVAGQTIALAFCSANIWSLLLAFLLFRLFDIVKPGPIGWLDRNVKGAMGIMLDDIAAGFMALVLLLFLNLAI